MTHVARWLTALDRRRAATVLFGSIVVIGIVGALTAWLDPGNVWLDLDSELSLGWPPSKITLPLPAIWSAFMTAFAGIGWLAVGWGRPVTRAQAAALVFGLLLLFFAFDELFIIHERLESRTGIDWQLIYAPIAAVAVAVLTVLIWQSRARGHGISGMLTGAGLSWAVANALEYVQWRGDEKIEAYVLLMVPEEMLELVGSALLVLAAIAMLQSTAVTPKTGAPTIKAIG